MGDRDVELTAGERAALLSVAAKIRRPELGLPDPVFAFALKVAGMTNVDLLTVDDRGRVLLAWREDAFAEGWHVPGGIIRAGEGIERRIAETARTELHSQVEAEAAPRAMLQFRGQRGSFISLVFRCRLRAASAHAIDEELAAGAPGQLCWFAETPARMLPSHEVYRDLLPRLRSDGPGGAPIMRTTLYHPDSGWSQVGMDGGGA